MRIYLKDVMAVARDIGEAALWIGVFGGLWILVFSSITAAVVWTLCVLGVSI